jgi:hypothetical protein
MTNGGEMSVFKPADSNFVRHWAAADWHFSCNVGRVAGSGEMPADIVRQTTRTRQFRTFCRRAGREEVS